MVNDCVCGNGLWGKLFIKLELIRMVRCILGLFFYIIIGEYCIKVIKFFFYVLDKFEMY